LARHRKPLLSTMDVGRMAQHYATRPYGHYRAEVYRLFIDVLAWLRSPIRILDVGAGPGHLAHEYFKRHPRRRDQFVLLDASSEILKIARSRLGARADRVRTFVRSFNMPNWDRGIGRFDAVVSNNALFHVRPHKLPAFYRACFARLRKDGILLNQQSFAYEDRASPYGDDPFALFTQKLPAGVLPQTPGLTAAAERRLQEEAREAAAEHSAALAEARAAGVRFADGQTGYQFLTVGHHIERMRKAGFQCGCIWRKREFAVVLGLKGSPRLTR